MFELITTIVFVLALYIVSRTIIRQISGKGCGSKTSCSDCNDSCIGKNNL